MKHISTHVYNSSRQRLASWLVSRRVLHLNELSSDCLLLIETSQVGAKMLLMLTKHRCDIYPSLDRNKSNFVWFAVDHPRRRDH